MKRVFQFYLISFIFSWGVWILGMVFLADRMHPTLLVSIGGIGPLVGLVYYLMCKDTPSVKAFFKHRFFPHHRLGWTMIWLAIFLPILVLIDTYLWDWIFQTRFLIAFDENFLSTWLISSVFIFFFGPLPEEMAWRGLAFHDLSKESIIKAQVIVMVLWALWHVPLFFIRGTYQAELGIMSLSGLLFFVNILSLSILTGWLYVLSQSIFVVTLFHYMVNLLGEVLVPTKEQTIIRAVIYGVLAVISVIVYLTNQRKESLIKDQ